MGNLNFILEQVNGSVALLTFFFLCFSSWYLWDFLAYRGFAMRAALVGLPPAVTLLLVMDVEKLGTLMTRSVIWGWRIMGGGLIPFSHAETTILLVGASLTAIGLLLLIRLLSRPYFGEWPWLVSGGISLAQIGISTAFHLWG